MANVTTSLTTTQTTVTTFVGWAGDSASAVTFGISHYLAALGFTLQADTYTANWTSYMAQITAGTAAVLGTEAVISSLNGSAFPSGAFPLGRVALASTNFNVGGGTAYAGGTTYSRGNVVTFTPAGGFAGVYIFINVTPTAGQAPTSYAAPNTTLNSTYWQPYSMEVWKWNAGPSVLTPIYMKIEYGWSTTAVADLEMTVQFGTGYSTGASGYLTGNVSNAEYVFAGGVGYAASEFDFAGDGINYLAMNMQRGNAGVTSGPAIFCAERSIAGTAAGAPVYNSSYITYVRGCAAVTNWCQQTMFLSGTPILAIRVLYGNSMTLGGATASLVVNNTTPAMPVFPLVGYCGNPMTCLIVQNTTDTTEGATQSCTVYGSTHNFIMTKTAFALGILGLGQTTMAGVGVRFD